MIHKIKQSSLPGYIVAILASLLAFLVRFLLQPILGESAPLLVFIMPIVISGWYGGMGAGLIATITSALIGTYSFVEPPLSFSINDLSNGVRVSIFLLEGILISSLNEALLVEKKRTEKSTQALQDSEERYRLLLEGIEDYAIYLLDAEGYISTWNNAAEHILGYSASQALGQHFSIFFTPEAIAQKRPQQELQVAITQGQYKTEEWRQRRDGSIFWADIAVTALWDENNNLRGFSKVARDITERKQAQEALIREKASADFERKRLRTVLDLLPVGVFIANERGRIMEINAAAKEIWGEAVALPESINEYSSYRGWFAETGKFIEAEEWALARAMLHGEISINEEINIETIAGEHKTILNSAVPIWDEKGNIINAVVVNVDITKVKEAQDALKRAAERLQVLQDIDRSILEAQYSQELATQALSRLRRLVACEQVLVVLLNFETYEAQLFARSFDGNQHPLDGVVIPIQALIPDPISPTEAEKYIEYIQTHQQCLPTLIPYCDLGNNTCLRIPLVVEGNLIGELVLFRSSLQAFSEEDKEIAQEVASPLAIAIQQARLREQLQGYAVELEQRVQARTQELQEVNEALEAFAYSVSHDLRTPVRAMEGLGQAVLEDYGAVLDEQGQDFIQRIIGAAQTMDILIRDLLDYSRLTRSEVERRSLNLDSIVAEVLRNLESEIQNTSAIVTASYPFASVMGHASTLRQVLTNLILNALKFTNSQPQIRIWTEERGEWVRLWIEDNGIGIAPQYQERIFQVFERLHGVETYPGTGIGLALVRKGVERMGGQVGVESLAGQGSRFWIELLKE